MENLKTKNEDRVKGIIAFIAVLLVVILLFIGKYMFPNVDAVIKSLIKDVNGTFVQVKTNPHIIDARCYREGKTKGIVMEYSLSKRMSENKIDVAQIKRERIKDFKSQNVKEVVELGIYFIVIYKNYKDEEIVRITITADDLQN